MSSSTFSFDSLRGVRPRVPTALIAALAIVVCVEGAVRLTPDAIVVPERGWLGEFYYVEQVLAGRTTPPQVVVMGSSRIGCALSSTVLERELGLPPDSCLNLGLLGGRVGDALNYYRRNRPLLRQSKLIILNLDEFHFSTGFPFDPRIRLHTSFAQRLSLTRESVLPDAPPEQLAAARARKRAQLQGLRNGLLLDALFTARVRFKYLRRGLVARLKGWTPPPRLDAQGREAELRRLLADTGKASVTTEHLEATAETYYRDFDVHPNFVEDLEAFLREVQADGVKVVLFQIPNRGEYQDLVDARYASSFELFTKTARRVSGEREVPFFQWRRPQELGLTNADYGDYGHMSGQATVMFSRFTSQLIRREGLLD